MLRKVGLRAASTWWGNVPQGPLDPIIGITEMFTKDPNPEKINLGAGAYRDDNGKPFVLPSVKQAEALIASRNPDKEYIPIAGIKLFTENAVKLAFGQNGSDFNDGNYSSVQSISGTGALRLAAEYIARFLPAKKVHLPGPTWGNHIPILKHAGVAVGTYTYYNPAGCDLNFEGMVNDIKKIPAGECILLHACAHNPTGVDPSKEQWKELSQVIKEQGLLVFFDMAYQGFASGDIDKDAYAVRQFVKDGHKILLAQSFAKNMGLYGERCGAFSVMSDTAAEAAAVESQIKIIIRAMYSNPPFGGARIASEILTNQDLYNQWLIDVKLMADRIIDMRAQLTDELTSLGSSLDWSHINNQIGMFCYSGLKPEQVDKLKEESIYLTRDGRISIAGVTSKNVKKLAQGMHNVTK